MRTRSKLHLIAEAAREFQAGAVGRPKEAGDGVEVAEAPR